jgi:predicted transcriptional regulator
MSKANVDAIALLRKRCEASSMTAVAAQAGVSVAMVSQVLKGKKTLGAKLARFLGVREHIQRTYTAARTYTVDKRR